MAEIVTRDVGGADATIDAAILGGPGSGGEAVPNTTYLLFLLMLTNAFSYLDRQLPFILAEPIKRELSLSDTQLGLLGGAAFMIVYSTVAIPLSRLADRRSHIGVLSGAVVVWSLFTAAGAWAQSFTQLVMSRVGVALGEAGAIPPAHALIARIYPAKTRGRAMSFYQLGLPLGTMVGLTGGGLIADSYGWRAALVIMGLPGALLGILIYTTTRVPPQPAPVHADTPSTWRTLWQLMADPVYRNLVFGITAYAFLSYGVSVFQPAVLIRTFGMSTAQAGTWLGISHGVMGVIGTLAGGYFGDRFSRRDPRGKPWFAAGVMAVSLPFFLGAQFVATSGVMAVIMLCVPFAAWVAFLPPVYSAVQETAPPHLRATAAGLLVLCVNLIGSALGPVITGRLSDLLTPRLGADGLRVALACSSVFIIWSTLHFLRAAHHMRRRSAGLPA
jgi:MFS family permease